jgi:hypothetical protein
MYTRGGIDTLRKEMKEGKEQLAEGKTKANTMVLGVQVGPNLWVVKKGVGTGINIKPRVGATVLNFTRDEYKESGGENRLEVSKNDLTRIVAEMGLGAEGKINRKINWNAELMIDTTLRGYKNQVSAKGLANGFYGNSDLLDNEYTNEFGVPVESNNIEEGRVKIGGGVGLDYTVAKDVKIGANISGEKGSNYSEVKGNMNLNLKIGKVRGVKAEIKALKRAKERILLQAQDKIEDKKDDIRSAVKKKKERIKGKKKEMEMHKKELVKKIKETRSQKERLAQIA